MKSSTKKFLVLLAIVLVSIYILVRVDSSLNIDRNCIRIAQLEMTRAIPIDDLGIFDMQIIESKQSGDIHFYSVATMIKWNDGTFGPTMIKSMNCRIIDDNVLVNITD